MSSCSAEPLTRCLTLEPFLPRHPTIPAFTHCGHLPVPPSLPSQTGLAGVPHIGADANGHKDFTPLIKRAQALPGYTADRVAAAPKKRDVTVGFGHNAVLSVAPQVIDAIKGGKLEHIFLVGG